MWSISYLDGGNGAFQQQKIASKPMEVATQGDLPEPWRSSSAG